MVAGSANPPFCNSSKKENPTNIIAKVVVNVLFKIFVDFEKNIPFLITFNLSEILVTVHTPASWPSGNAFVSGAEGLRFKSRAGQIGHSVANGLPMQRHFFQRSCVTQMQ